MIRFCVDVGGRDFFIRALGARVDPALDGRDLLGRRSVLGGRHLRDVLPVADEGVVQHAHAGSLRDDHRSGVAALLDVGVQIEAQFTLLLSRAVATDAERREDRLHVAGIVDRFGCTHRDGEHHERDEGNAESHVRLAYEVGELAGFHQDTQSTVGIPSGFLTQDPTDRPVRWGMSLRSDPTTAVVCREILEHGDPILPAARLLYETTLDEDARIPWEWLARTPERRRTWKPGTRRAHLVVATPTSEPNRPVGFGYGAFLPGYGGYVCYLGVDPIARGQGTGTELFRFLFQLIEDAAHVSSMPLPFIIWESHRPDDPELWAARLRTFHKAGGLWMKGVEMQTPNYMREGAPPVRLNLFLRPYDEPASVFDGERLRAAVRGLYEQVYHIAPDDSLHRETLDAAVNPRLVATVEDLKEA